MKRLILAACLVSAALAGWSADEANAGWWHRAGYVAVPGYSYYPGYPAAPAAVAAYPGVAMSPSFVAASPSYVQAAGLSSVVASAPSYVLADSNTLTLNQASSTNASSASGLIGAILPILIDRLLPAQPGLGDGGGGGGAGTAAEIQQLKSEVAGLRSDVRKIAAHLNVTLDSPATPPAGGLPEPIAGLAIHGDVAAGQATAFQQQLVEALKSPAVQQALRQAIAPPEGK